MNKEEEQIFDYPRFIPVLAGISLVVVGGFWLLFFLGSGGILFTVISGGMLIISLYILYIFITAFAKISLLSQDLVIKQWGKKYTILYDEINKINQNQFFITLETDQGVFRIHKHSINHQTLYHQLEMRAFSLSTAQLDRLDAPLPLTLKGRLLKPFVFALVGGGLVLVTPYLGFAISEIFKKGPWLALVGLTCFIIIWMTLVYALLHPFLFESPWRITFTPQQIVVRYILRRKTFNTNNIKAIRLLTQKIVGTSGKTSEKSIVFLFSDDSTFILKEEEINYPYAGPYACEELATRLNFQYNPLEKHFYLPSNPFG